MSWLEGSNRSDAARSFSKDIGKSDCENRTNREGIGTPGCLKMAWWLAWPLATSEH